MNLFVKANHFDLKFLWMITVIADVALIIFGIQDNTLNLSFAIASGLTILVLVLWLFAKNEGLLIEDDKLCYKSLRKKYYEINQIAGLHIVKDQIPLKRFISIDVKNKYKIIYLKDRDYEKRSTDNGFWDFWIHHSKHILFFTVYDEKVIEYFNSKGILITGTKQ